QLSTTINSPAKQKPVVARRAIHVIGSMTRRWRSGIVDAIAPKAAKVRMADTFDDLVAVERSNDDACPKACPDRADLGRRKSFDIAANAQQRSLERIAHLHQREARQQGEQMWQNRPHCRCHVFHRVWICASRAG